MNDILARLSREIDILVPSDFCLFMQYDDKNKCLTIVHQSGPVGFVTEGKSLAERMSSILKSSPDDQSKEVAGRSFPLEEGTLINQMMGQWVRKQATPYHFFDLHGRTVLGLFDTTAALTRQLRSLSCWPLSTAEKFIGAFFLGSLQPDAFSEFHRGFLDTLSNQIALVMDNAILHRQISNLARSDGLTGLLNHRTFMEKLAEEYRRIDRLQRPFSILLMDIDKFKNVNDTYGHPVGDVAIKAVAKVLKDTVRGTDFVCRYGGEEFAVGMVDTDSAGASLMAERVRIIMEKTIVTKIAAADLKITLSIGVSSFPSDTTTLPDLVTLADNALYQAKRSGRNKVCVVKDIPENVPVDANSGEKR